MVLVFASNYEGIHASGAALYARRYFGARMGVGEGPMGDSYAIPVRSDPRTVLALYVIRQNIERFCHYAKLHPRKQFKIARFTAGHTDEQIVTLFNHPPANCTFDPRWAKFGLATWEKPAHGTLPEKP